MKRNPRRQKIRALSLLLMVLLFPIILNFFSPYIIVDGASQGIVTGSFITFGALFLGSLLFGRAFCGWLCPGGGIQEACMSVSNKKARGGKLDWIKYAIWLPWVGLIIALIVLAGGLRAVDPLYNPGGGPRSIISITEPAHLIIYFSVVALIIGLALTTGRRGFCHYGCWMAQFVVLGTKIKNTVRWPSLHLRPSSNRCKQCRTCEGNCPMSLPVTEMVSSGSMNHPECILCGTCVDNCPNGAITYSWGRPQR